MIKDAKVGRIVGSLDLLIEHELAEHAIAESRGRGILKFLLCYKSTFVRPQDRCQLRIGNAENCWMCVQPRARSRTQNGRKARMRNAYQSRLVGMAVHTA